MVRLSRPDRRRQLLDCAIATFDEVGWSETTVELIARRADVTKAIVYRHFASKIDLWRAARTCANGRLAEAVGPAPYDAAIVRRLVEAAAVDPAAFRLVFADPPPAAADATEPGGVVDLLPDFVEHARREIGTRIADPRWVEWTARVALATIATAIIAWLDLEQPDPDLVVHRIESMLAVIVTEPSPPPS